MSNQIIKCDRKSCGNRGQYDICFYESSYRCNLLNGKAVCDSQGRFAQQIPAKEFEIDGERR